MAALTIASVANGTNENSSSIQCNGMDVGLRITTNATVTLQAQVSYDNSTFYPHPMSLKLSGTDVIPSDTVLASGSYAFTFDSVHTFMFFRVNIANASGGAATVSGSVTQSMRKAF